jgi:hypothetical protein
MLCPAWRRLTVPLPKTSSAAADEGTEAHALFESMILMKRVDCKNMEMFDYVGSCVDWVADQPGIIHAEMELDYGEEFGYVNLFGTADLIVDHPDCLTVGDLKYGFGIVEAEANSQMMIYLVGAVAKFGPRSSYRLVILQPRANHFKGPIREVIVTPEELDAFKAKLQAAIADSYTNKPPVVGAHCRKYCAALTICPGVKAHVIKLFKGDPDA